MAATVPCSASVSVLFSLTLKISDPQKCALQKEKLPLLCASSLHFPAKQNRGFVTHNLLLVSSCSPTGDYSLWIRDRKRLTACQLLWLSHETVQTCTTVKCSFRMKYACAQTGSGSDSSTVLQQQNPVLQPNNEHVRRPLNLLHRVRGLIVNSLTKNYSAELHGNFRFTPITRLMGLFSESGRRNYVPDRLERHSQSARGKR